jgi:hypothetical protein
MTMIVTLALLVVALGMATAGLQSTLDGRAHTTRDLRSERALQAADAGLATGIYRLNEMNLASTNFTGGLAGLASFADCLVPLSIGGGGTVTSFGLVPEVSVATGACPTYAGSGLSNALSDTTQVGDHAFYQVALVPNATALGPNIVFKNPKVVAVGVEDAGNSSTCTAKISPAPSPHATSGCVVRRVEATLNTVDPFQAIEANGNITLQSFAATVVNGDMRTNGSFSQSGLTYTQTNLFNGSLAGNVTYGTTKSFGALLPLVTTTKQAESVSRGAITINDTGCPSACVTPSLPAGVTATTLGGTNGLASAYNASTDAVAMTGGTMTLTPGDYIFCDFNVTGGTVKTNVPASSTTPVRIFIDSPSSSRCSANGLGAGQGNFRTSVGMQNLVGGVTTLLGSTELQIYLASGSHSNPSTVSIGGSLTESMFIYAPTSNVTMTALSFFGNMIANNVSVTGVAGTLLTISENLGLSNYSLANAVGTLYPTQYTECTPVYPLPTPDPTSGC